MTQAAIYARISADPEGLRAGVERQEADCRALAKRRGWKVAEVYVDNDVSAWNGKERPAYQRMLDDIEAGTIRAVVTYHLDRLHRSPKELEEFVEVCQRAGLGDVATVTGDLDIAESDGLFSARILTAVGRKSSDDSSRRIRRKMEDIAREGRPSGGGRRPFGFEPDGVTVRKDEAALIREAARRALAGEGLFGIASDWNRRGIATVTGARWSTRSLKRILTSPRWAGLREYKGAVVGKAGWPAIIRKDVHERLRVLLLDPGRSNGGTTARKYLLPGFVYCKVCGDRLVSRPRRRGGKGENVRSYTCIAEHPGARVSIIAEPLEDLVRDKVFDALDTPALSKAIRAQAGHDEEQKITLDAIRDDEAALEQLARDLYVDRVISRSEFISARKALEDRIESARRRLERVERADVVASLPSGRAALEKAWETRGLEWRRAVLRTLIDRITVSPALRGRNFFDADRVQITWRV